MDILIIVGVALGLSMDAFAVSVANGIMISEIKLRHSLRIAFFFGSFQALMPVIGWAAGMSLQCYIQKYDHWIAFAMLCAIGIKMIWESRRNHNQEKRKSCLHFPTLILMSFATSIDALAVGVSFAVLDISIIQPIIIIGIITFIVSFVGTQMGKSAGHVFENYAKLAGGIILIIIGVKILVEHLSKRI